MSKKAKTADLPHMINLVMGDWSNDGHSKTETVTILSNLVKKDVEKAYAAGVKKSGVKFDEEVAAEYEDRTIPVEVVESLSKHGFKIEDYSDDDEPSELGYSLWTDGYAEAWLFVAQLGNPDFKFEITDDESPNINIGGYGLFE